jgi:hypothetical protein
MTDRIDADDSEVTLAVENGVINNSDDDMHQIRSQQQSPTYPIFTNNHHHNNNGGLLEMFQMMASVADQMPDSVVESMFGVKAPQQSQQQQSIQQRRLSFVESPHSEIDTSSPPAKTTKTPVENHKPSSTASYWGNLMYKIWFCVLMVVTFGSRIFEISAVLKNGAMSDTIQMLAFEKTRVQQIDAEASKMRRMFEKRFDGDLPKGIWYVLAILTFVMKRINVPYTMWVIWFTKTYL